MNKREYLRIIYADYVVKFLSDEEVEEVFNNVMKNTDILNKAFKKYYKSIENKNNN